MGCYKRYSQGCAAEQKHAMATHEGAAEYYRMMAASIFAKEVVQKEAAEWMSRFKAGLLP